ncbi:hypothetical protein RB653_005172 [Dictyostelium firmibasis]|uniref:Meiotic nuclear division protein 1 homolog n=1 Tax=Dictyostelium firmibasis TaxID=79012 RepID=A0AAN7UC12_9MYCE
MATRRKGMSPEEKKEKLKEFFHSNPTIYSAKEVEPEASKYTGMTQIQCKETLQMLIDDGVVNTDKMGSSNYYWSFPSFEFDSKKDKIVEQSKLLGETKERIQSETKKIEQLKTERVESETRTKNLEKLQTLKDDNKSFKEELLLYADSSLIDDKKRDIKIAIAAVNRYTDNISSLRQFCDSKYNIRPSDFDTSFGIKSDMDYLEEYNFNDTPQPANKKKRK